VPVHGPHPPHFSSSPRGAVGGRADRGAAGRCPIVSAEARPMPWSDRRPVYESVPTHVCRLYHAYGGACRRPHRWGSPMRIPSLSHLSRTRHRLVELTEAPSAGRGSSMRTHDRMRLSRTPPQQLTKCADGDVRMTRGSPTARLSAIGSIDGLPFMSPPPRRRRGVASELATMRCTITRKVCGRPHHGCTSG
jgi:hypothetical protein